MESNVPSVYYVSHMFTITWWHTTGQISHRVGHPVTTAGQADGAPNKLYITDISQTVQAAGTIMAWNLHVGKN